MAKANDGRKGFEEVERAGARAWTFRAGKGATSTR